MSNKRMTLEQRMEARDRGTATSGREVGWQVVALDLYLEGEKVCEICDICRCTPKGFYSAIAKEALYRLMKAANCVHLEDMKDLEQHAET